MLNCAGYSLANAATWPNLLDDSYHIALYNLSCVASTGFALHCAFVSSFVVVYGQNLAINGDAGSVANAVMFIVKEQITIFRSSMLSAFFFGISLITSYFWVMSLYAATAASFVTACLMYLWYTCCLRIYNSFKVSIAFDY